MWKFIAPPRRQAALTSTVPSPGIEPPTFSLRSVKLSPRKQPCYTERTKTTKQTTGENREDASWHSSGVTYAALTCQPSASFGGLDEPRHRRVAYSKQAWACSGCRYHNDHREFKLSWVEELALFWVNWRDVGNTETSAHKDRAFYPTSGKLLMKAYRSRLSREHRQHKCIIGIGSSIFLCCCCWCCSEECAMTQHYCVDIRGSLVPILVVLRRRCRFPGCSECQHTSSNRLCGWGSLGCLIVEVPCGSIELILF